MPLHRLMMADLHYETVFDPQPADSALIGQGVQEFNRSVLGDYDSFRLAVFVRDENQNIIGGLLGILKWEWLYVSGLWVHKDLRSSGVGSKLLQLAEEAAADKGVYKIHLETTSFQAIDFYLKNGYKVFAKLEGKPTGHTWYYLKKEAPQRESRA